MKVLTAEAMQAVDRAAIEEIGIPALVLMENAAAGVVEAILEQYPRAGSAAIFCGPGNNGGDGLAVARLLTVRGVAVRVFLATLGKALSPDAAIQLAIVRRMEIELAEIPAEADLEPFLVAAGETDLLVDALFGTGLTRPLAGQAAELVTGLGRLGRPCVAVDLPSGLSGSSAALLGPHAPADLTVTFAAPKLAHVLSPAAEACGEVVVADLGIPPELVDRAAGDLFLLEPDEVAAAFPVRAVDTHKGTYGHLLLVAGGPGRAGAAILAARAAVRTGAGLVTVAVPAGIRDAVDLGSLESMTLALPTGADGELAEAAAAAVLAASQGKTAVAIGPGLGTTPGAVAAVRRIARECELPLLIDADGLNALAGRLDDLADRRAPTVLTPHPGEMGRLLGVETSELQADRLGAARQAARRSGAVVVLKGHRTLIASPAGPVWINPTGNPGLASGGSGDVLTGMIASLLAQGREVVTAATAGAFMHGLAGDRLAERTGPGGIAAGDLAAEIPAAIRDLAADGSR